MKLTTYFDSEDNSKTISDIQRYNLKRKTHRKVPPRKTVQFYAIDEHNEHFKTTDIEKAVEYLSAYNIAYAHNVGYDLGNIIGHKLDTIDDAVFVGSRLIRCNHGGVCYLDSFNLYPMGLAKIGKELGLKKKTLNLKGWDYVAQDVEILKASVEKFKGFICSLGVDSPGNTLAGNAVRVWKAFGGQNWFCDDIKIKEAYYGGRVEIFNQELSGDLKYTDINSLFPSCLRNLYPSEKEIKYGKEWDEFKYGVAEVEIDIPNSFICPLPWRRDDGAVLFPCGKITGTWTVHEIQNAVKHGSRVIRTNWVYGTNYGQRYYKEFVERIYKLRLVAIQNKQSAESLMLKLLMNSLYGQLGMSGSLSRLMNLTEADIYDIENIAVIGDSKKLADHEIPLPEHVNYLHAAYTTSYARIELQNYLRKIPQPEKTLGYCDTDSIIFKGKLPFPVGKNLGEMKLENEGTHAYFYNPKGYEFTRKTENNKTKTEYKAKGVRKKYAARFLNDRENGVLDFQPYRLKEALMFWEKGTRPCSYWRAIIKKMKTDYNKKILKKGCYFPLKITN